MAEAVPSRGLTNLILAMLLVAVLSGLLAQSWRASHLEGRVGELEAQLGTAQGELRAHQAHLSLVREAVGGVSRELTALEQLMEQQPEYAAGKARRLFGLLLSASAPTEGGEVRPVDPRRR